VLSKAPQVPVAEILPDHRRVIGAVHFAVVANNGEIDPPLVHSTHLARFGVYNDGVAGMHQRRCHQYVCCS